MWTTKNRIPFLKDCIRESVIYHIRDNARLKGIYIDHINGYHEHLHMIVSIGNRQTISDIMHKVKGESSFWINKNKLTETRFEWQDDYIAVSIDNNHLTVLRKNIRNQPFHRQKVLVHDELERLILEYEMERITD
ncbi:MAG: transposase [Bacteroidales bacterium]|nr:transposase [Bacteroidales bacterium]